MSSDLISRSALHKRMFPYEVVDKREYSINAKAVEKAILEAPAVQRPTVVTLHGYNVEGLALVAELLRKHGVTEDDLDYLHSNFQKMYSIIIQDQKMILEGTMAKFTYPSVGEVYKKMFEEANHE